MKAKEKIQRRKKRVRSKVFGTKKRPRLSVFRSNKFIYAQLIDDEEGKTLLTLSEKSLSKKLGNLKKVERAQSVGEEIAKKAKLKKITEVVFDRSSYRYHGRVRALAEGARKGGLKF